MLPVPAVASGRTPIAASSTSLVARVSGGLRIRNHSTSTAAAAPHASAAARNGLAMIHDTIDVLARLRTALARDDDVSERIDGAGMAGRAAGQWHVGGVARVAGRNAVAAAAADLAAARPSRPCGAVAPRR